MIARLAILGAALLLAGCNEPTPEQRLRVRQQLPSGCDIHSFGEYGPFNDLVVVICDGRATSSLNQHWTTQCGKSTCHHYSATFFIKPAA